MEAAWLRFTEQDPETDGMTIVASPGFEQTPGPTPGSVAAFRREASGLHLKLDTPLGPRGGFALWVRTERPLFNGVEAEETETGLLTARGVGTLGLKSGPVCAGIAWLFDDPVAGVARTHVPGLPGPQWLHLVYSWDAAEGVYEAYANGTPLKLPGTKLPPWEMGSARELLLHLTRMAVAELRVFDAPLTQDDVEALVPSAYRGSLDGLIGARERGALDPDALRGETLYENALASAEQVEDWVMEGPAELSFEDGWMRMASKLPDGPMGHIVHWCPEDFPESYVIEWDIQPLSEAGLCIVFFAARAVNGEDIFNPDLAPRDGTFSHYTVGDVNSYHCSYYANTPGAPGRVTANLRKNSGFYLVDNGPPGIPPGSRGVHHVTVVKRGPDVDLGVDGRRIIHFHDDDKTYGRVLGGGKVGLRQMQWMAARYRNFRVSEVR